MVLEFSVFATVDHDKQSPVTMQARLHATVEHAMLAEKLRFNAFYVTEHHLSSYGLVANPAILLALIAARTQTIHLGPAIANLNARTALTVAEDYALLDQLSLGRVKLGVGPGLLPAELTSFKVDSSERSAMFWQRAGQLRALLSNRPVNQEDERNDLQSAELGLPTERLVGPRISVATFNAECAYQAGAEGFGLLLMPHACCADWSALAELVDAFVRGFKQRLLLCNSPLLDYVQPSITLFMPVHVGDSPQIAELAFAQHMSTRHYPLTRSLAELSALGFAITRETQDIAGLLAKLVALGISEFVGLHAFGDIEAQAANRSLQNFADNVMPEFRRSKRQYALVS